MLIWKLAMPFALGALGSGLGAAWAHGVHLTQAACAGFEIVEITATYDTGEPMTGARVTVFSPASPSEPWMTGISDGAGRFRFVPDTALPGYWAVQIRRDGHGGFIMVPVAERTDGEPPCHPIE
ncbi:MAG: carboxypeptidase-like regulatory domain-containing protein [Candidatus Competibacteraceae bacterium]|nr:carboxypeptidase-like regulatory domain-containing protein [Candidatus Competibacteraceae bacterium]